MLKDFRRGLGPMEHLAWSGGNFNARPKEYLSNGQGENSRGIEGVSHAITPGQEARTRGFRTIGILMRPVPRLDRGRVAFISGLYKLKPGRTLVFGFQPF